MSELAAILAPGAGSGLGRKLAEELEKRPRFIEALADAYMDGLKATVSRWNVELKAFEDIPDAKTRVLTANAIIANMEGEPVKRVLVAQGAGNRKSETDARVIERIAASPALQGQLEAQIRRARGGKKTETLDD